LISALTRATKDRPTPTEEFCVFLEELGLVTSRRSREECLEMWDYHWKKTVSCLESNLLKTKKATFRVRSEFCDVSDSRD